MPWDRWGKGRDRGAGGQKISRGKFHGILLCLLVVLGLGFPQLAVDTVRMLHQLVVVPHLYDLSLVKDVDFVAETAAGHTMGYVNGCFVLYQFVEMLVDFVL